MLTLAAGCALWQSILARFTAQRLSSLTRKHGSIEAKYLEIWQTHPDGWASLCEPSTAVDQITVTLRSLPSICCHGTGVLWAPRKGLPVPRVIPSSWSPYYANCLPSIRSNRQGLRSLCKIMTRSVQVRVKNGQWSSRSGRHVRWKWDIRTLAFLRLMIEDAENYTSFPHQSQVLFWLDFYNQYSYHGTKAAWSHHSLYRLQHMTVPFMRQGSRQNKAADFSNASIPAPTSQLDADWRYNNWIGETACDCLVQVFSTRQK